MKVSKHREQSLIVLAGLARSGFSPEVQQRLGAFGVVWGLFESNLEATVWALRDEKVAGARPSTDRTMISDWIDVMAKGSAKLTAEAQGVLCLAALAAKDLMEYRHALVHGSLILFPTMPIFIRNPRWKGESRKRPTSTAHVDENLLDMAIDAALTLYRVVVAAQAACIDRDQASDLTALRSDVARAKSLANELRHLAELMNAEKY